MNFFKSSKYKLEGSNNTKSKSGEKQHVEHFHKIENPSTLDNGRAAKGKAPQRPHDGKSNSQDVQSCFRICNKSSSSFKIKDSTDKSIFPTEIPAGSDKLVRMGKNQAGTQATYLLDISENGESKSFEFEVKVVCKDGKHELLVDWMNLSELEGVQLKPDLASSNQPIKLGLDEMLVELQYS